MEYIGFSSQGGGYELMDRIAKGIEKIAQELHTLNESQKANIS